jgi:hypothetical protein
VVIDKPPDVRMDGDFPVTVEKLLSHWFPSSALASNLPSMHDTYRQRGHDSIPVIESSSPTGVASANTAHTVTSNARVISAPSKFRWIHQLDFATSGVLLVAKTKLGA